MPPVPASAQHIPLIISGGIGHSTPFLYAAVSRHSAYNLIPTTGRKEAEIIADIAEKFWKIKRKTIFVEKQSTNCGENARFSMDMMLSHGMNVKTVLIVQDPALQRRTMATFARASRAAPVPPLAELLQGLPLS
jgi:uncharacterized SAM-binding protein YcdF (DUF218 family)